MKLSIKMVFIMAILIIIICYKLFNYPSNQRNFQHSQVSIKKKFPYITIIAKKKKIHSFQRSYLIGSRTILIIYIHHEHDFISNSILHFGTWERGLIDQLEDYIHSNPGIQVLDAGCNIGVYTLTAASMGCRVVAVDPNANNTSRLVQSLIANNLTENVTICLNALNNVRKDFILSKEENNIGGQYVIENKNDAHRVKGIIMDDLLPLFKKYKPIFIKIDIQGKEIEAFQNASRFFDNRNVKLVMIEWEWIRNMAGIEGLIMFFSSRGFKPYKEFAKINLLEIEDYINWPYDVMWIKE